MNTRPPAEAVFALEAPGGVFAVSPGSVALDVRCNCRQLLLRLVRSEGGLLGIWRHHNPPTQAQLAAKGGAWSGGAKTDARIVYERGRTEVRDVLSTEVGWWDDAAWYPADAGRPSYWPANVWCECGLFTVWEELRPSVEACLLGHRQRVLTVPKRARFDRAGLAAWYLEREQ